MKVITLDFNVMKRITGDNWRYFVSVDDLVIKKGKTTKGRYVEGKTGT